MTRHDPDLTLSQQAKERLLGKYRKARSNAVHDDSTLFISRIENTADYLIALQELQPESQQRRRERLTSIANHLDAALDQIKQLDSAALGFAVWRGFEELATSKGESNTFPSGMKGVEIAYSFREENLNHLATAALGIRKAAEELPPHSMNSSGKDYPWWSLPVELAAAMSIERIFWEYQLEFTVSDSGFAADCLREVYGLSGMQIDRVSYWLKNAKEHHDSMFNVMQRLQKPPEE